MSHSIGAELPASNVETGSLNLSWNEVKEKKSLYSFSPAWKSTPAHRLFPDRPRNLFIQINKSIYEQGNWMQRPWAQH